MSGLAIRLREETAALHGIVEREVGLMDPGLDRAGYGALLHRLHRFHHVVEGSAGAALADEAFLAPRRRLADLDADLAALGLGPPAPPRAAEEFSLCGPAEAMGLLYVTEGSRLGGRLIARHLGPRLGLAPGRGLSYFAGAGSDPGRLWAGFRARLQAYDGEADRVVAAATATFALFRRMVCRPVAAPAEDAPR